jgi:hypothetical protein
MEQDFLSYIFLELLELSLVTADMGCKTLVEIPLGSANEAFKDIQIRRLAIFSPT